MMFLPNSGAAAGKGLKELTTSYDIFVVKTI
jgi:hypothetical protein